MNAFGSEFEAELLGESGEWEFARWVRAEEARGAFAGERAHEHQVAAAVEEIGCEGLGDADGGEEIELPEFLEFVGWRGDGVAAHRAAGTVGDEIDAMPTLVDRDVKAFDVGGAGDVGLDGE